MKSDFSKFAEVVDTAAKFKAAMMKRGITSARTNCPRCAAAAKPGEPSGATLYGYISGPRNHFRMSCRNGCGMAMME